MMRRILFQVYLYAREQKINKDDFGEGFLHLALIQNERKQKNYF